MANTYQGPFASSMYASTAPIHEESGVHVTLEGSTNSDKENERIRTKSNSSMLCILVVGRENIELGNDEEEDAVLIDDNREPTMEDAVIDLSINSKALRLLNVFLFMTLQRIPRHYSKKGTLIKSALSVAQVIAVLLLFATNLYELGLFGDSKTLTVNELDNTVTSVKNILSNLKFPLLYVVGIFYFRTRHFEKLLSEVRLTRRYWKHGKRVIFIAIAMMCLFSVVVPVICKATQMSLPRAKSSSNDKLFNLDSILGNSFLYICVRAISLTIVFAFVIIIYLIYYQIRFFKEQILKWPKDCKRHARDAFVDIKSAIKDIERYFQPFLVVHLTIFLTMIIPLIISGIEQFEAEGMYTKAHTPASKMIDPNIIILPPVTTPISPVVPTRSVINSFGAAPTNDTQNKLDNTSKTKLSWKEKMVDYVGIGKLILEFAAQLFEILFLYSLPIILLGKVDKCIKSIAYDIEMLKFSQQMENMYMFQTLEDVKVWVAEINAAKGIQILGMSLTSFRAVIITLLFPFVTVMFRIMLRHVDINP